MNDGYYWARSADGFGIWEPVEVLDGWVYRFGKPTDGNSDRVPEYEFGEEIIWPGLNETA